MPDTKRSLAEIYALFPDAPSGEISAADLRANVFTLADLYERVADNDLAAQSLRDLIKTLQPDHGEISITSTAETTIPDTSTYVMAAGTYALSANAMDWDMDTNGQLRYTGTADRVVHIAASFSLTAAANNKTFEIGAAKNGTVIASSLVQRKIATGADVGSSAAHAFTTVSTNDYLTLVVRGLTDATNCTAQTVNLFAMGMAA